MINVYFGSSIYLGNLRCNIFSFAGPKNEGDTSHMVKNVTRYVKKDVERELWARAAGRC